jgi:DNA-directed RNA polymerase subunit RPC12/RpoP
MALLKCHECGNDVSSESKACPKCGAKVKKPTSLAVKMLAVLFGIGIFSSYLGSQHGSNSNVTASEVEKINTAPQVSWVYSKGKDQMSGKDIVYANTKSLNTEDLKWPYGPGIGARLTLRNHPREGKDAYVSIDKGQILFKSYNRLYVMVRFDDRPAIQFEGSGASDMSTNFVFISDYKKFLAELKKSKTVRFELPIYQDANRTWQFNVSNLLWQ